MWMLVIAGLMLGLISSFHCVGMCGPIALALPVQHLSGTKRFLSVLAYNLGRVFTYTTLGVVLGLFGRQVHLAGFQSWFSIALGVIMLIAVSFYFVSRNPLEPGFARSFHQKIQLLMSSYLRSKEAGGFFVL